MKRLTLFAIVILIVLFVVDISMANWANRRIIARDADFAENYNPEALDWDVPGRFCNFQYELKIYAYQTCFRVHQESNVIVYTYHAPRRRLAIWANHHPSALYFQEVTPFIWKIIHPNGSVDYQIHSPRLQRIKNNLLGE